MNATARDFNSQPADTNGLEDIFDDKIKGYQPLIQIDPDRKGIPLEQAASFLNLHIDTVRRYLKTGKLKGFKAKDKFGNKWFVDERELFLASGEIKGDQPLPKASIQIDPGLAQADQPLSNHSILMDVDPMFDISSNIVLAQDSQTLLNITETQSRVIENQSNQLKAAGDVIMYLRSQLEDKENTIKLLTDSQHKPSWWAKFSSWFFKAQ